MLRILPPPDVVFRELLTRYRLRADLSGGQLAHHAGLDPSYVTGLESGRRRAPGQDVIHRLAAALALTGAEEDRLVLLAGHAPPWMMAAARSGPVGLRTVTR